jgi:hypothetical protein
MNLQDPVNQNGSNVLVYLSLALHVAWVRQSLSLCLLHMQGDICTVLTDLVNVTERAAVHLIYVTDDITLDSLLVHGQFRGETNLWQPLF